MRKTKIVTSLIVIACVVFILGTISVYADNTTPTTITTITTNSGNNTANNAITIGNSASNNTNNNANNKVSNNAPTGITPIGNTNNASNTNRVSLYNNSSTTSQEELPYTGTNYSVVFVIVALVISAVYAYKKVTDYNV